MKNYILLFLFSICFFVNCFSQPEYFVHCYGSDTVLIEKIAEVTIGDTTVETFHDYTFDYGGAVNTDFNYYHFNDSIFSRFDGIYYLIGDNNPQIGDIWNPLRYYIYSYEDTTETCPHFMDIQVVSIEQILIEGVLTNYIHLKDLSTDTGLDFDYSFLAGAGVTQGGPLYNLAPKLPFPCDMIGGQEPTFKSYSINNDTYIESVCDTIDDVGVFENLNTEPEIIKTESYITFENVGEIIEISIIDLTGKVIFITSEDRLFYNKLNGIYFVKLTYDRGQIVKQMYFDYL